MPRQKFGTLCRDTSTATKPLVGAVLRSRLPRSGDPHRHVDSGRGRRQAQNHKRDRRHVVFRRRFEAVPHGDAGL